jgi:PAS domain S-box-containing protein
MYIILGNPHLNLLQKLFQLLCVILLAEFLRQNWFAAFGFNLPVFIHIPTTVVFYASLTHYEELLIGPGALPATILVSVLCYTFFCSAKKNKHSQLAKLRLLFFSIASLYIFQQLISLFPQLSSFFFDNETKKVSLPHLAIFQLFSMIFINILILSFRTKLQIKKEQPPENILAPANISPVWFVVLLIVTNLAGSVLVSAVENKEERRLRTGIEQSKESLEKLINQRMDFASTSSNLIAATPVISEYMTNPSPENQQSLNDFFGNFAKTFPDGLCYLMDKSGLVVAASAQKEIFLGRYLNFRTYFQDAIAGKNGKLIDYGKFTNELGYYSCHPIYNPRKDTIIGACAVKRNLSDLRQYFSLYHPSLLVDSGNKIFLASNLEFVHKMLRFFDGQHPSHTIDNPAAENWLKIDKSNYFHSSFSLGLGGWKVILFRSNQDLKSARLMLFFAATIFSLTLMSFFLGNVKKTELLINLQLTQEQFEALFYNAPEGILIISPFNLDIISANLGLVRLFKFTNNPAGLNFRSLLTDNYQNVFKNAKHNPQQRSFSYERDFKKADGQVFTAEVNGNSTLYNGEKAILLFIRDISFRVQNEQQLREAKNEAEMASQIKSRFLANTSHEIRTPMTAIIGLNEMARKQCTSEKQRHLLDLAGASAESLLNLLNDILDLSQIEAGKLRISKAAFNLRELLDQLVQITKLRSEQKGISTKINLSDDLPEYIVSDAHRIRQILLNLLSNASKFTTEGEIYFEASCKRFDQKDLELNFIISDSGEGILDEVKPNLFNPFVHTAPNNPDELRGTGLGLSISKQIIDMLGGKINVKSMRGEGTTFKVTIPAREAGTEQEKQLKPGSIKNNLLLSVSKQPLKVLVADDNETNLFLARSIIAEYDGLADCCKDGLEVMEHLQNSLYDAILLDIQMPNMDGIETLKQIRNSKAAFNKIPIIALSAFSTDEEKQMAIKSGANHYLAKPYSPADLLRSIQMVLNIELDKLQHSESPKPHKSISNELNLKQINLEELELRILQKPENILQINDIFSRRSRVLIEDLGKCLGEGSCAQLRETAHSVKGLAGMLAANSAFKQSQQIEKLAKEGQLAEAREQIPVLVCQINEISADLAQICAKIKRA